VRAERASKPGEPNDRVDQRLLLGAPGLEAQDSVLHTSTTDGARPPRTPVEVRAKRTSKPGEPNDRDDQRLLPGSPGFEAQDFVLHTSTSGGATTSSFTPQPPTGPALPDAG